MQRMVFFTSSQGSITIARVTLDAGNSALIKLQFKKDNKIITESVQVKVTAYGESYILPFNYARDVTVIAEETTI